MAANKLLCADCLFALVRAGLEQVTDQRADNAKISIPDALMSGFAMFSLKDPSLLAFDERRTIDSNLGSIYGIEDVPGDTQMRTILDDVDPVEIRPVFRDVGISDVSHLEENVRIASAFEQLREEEMAEIRALAQG